jgi:hypothetical protein
METAPLKSFAIWARMALIREVTARVAVALAPASPVRVEQTKAFEALEKAVAAAGGGDKGKAAIADKVAYTWFNRIIALRFMDANGYTGVGVVSPHSGVETGQPEILADAKRGNIDAAVVSPKTRETVVGLLNGTRRSDEPQGEAYALLLADYCRYWNRAMPFMFEREGDFTELLIPANLLADDSVPSRAVTVLTKEVCQDVEVIGWLYQFYISERKDEVFAGFAKNQKAGASEIPSATQLFTPHWIVRYLVENSLGRLWMLNRPSSRLVDQMDYYIAPVDGETDFLEIGSPEELKVVDPACGSGHMLTYAFDLLCAIYEAEGYAPLDIPALILANNLHGVEIDPRAGALAAFALTMKARANQRTFFNKPVEPNICVLDPISFCHDEIDFLLTRGGDRHAEAAFWNQFEHADTFGSLSQPDPDLTVRLARHLETLDADGDMLGADVLERAWRVIRQAEYLSRSYEVVVANPPYMGTRNMSDVLRSFAESSYPASSGDLCVMFIERSLALAPAMGIAALVVSESWLFNSTYEAFREEIVRVAQPILTACIDKSAFGVRLNTAATVFQRSCRPSHSQFFRVSQELLARGPITCLPPSDAKVYLVKAESFARVPGGAFAFDMPSPLLELYGKSDVLGHVYEARQGLATGNNSRFLRRWWEVSRSRVAYGLDSREDAQRSGCLWFPYNKGGKPVPWWGNQDHVIAFDDVNFQLLSKLGNKLPSRNRYFKSSITWSNIGSRGARFRYLPSGFVFDVSGMSLFVDDEKKRLEVLGYLNSQTVRQGLDVLAPTLNYQVGDVARLPLVTGEEDHERVSELVQLARAEWAESENAHEFQLSPFIGGGKLSMPAAAEAVSTVRRTRRMRIASLEEASNGYWVSRIAELSGNDRKDFPAFVARQTVFHSAADVVSDVVSYAVGCMFGRYSLDEPGLILADQGTTVQDYLAKVPVPTFAPDMDNVIPVVDGDWFEDDIVSRFRTFLRAAFGEQHFEENLRFVNESLGVRDLRDYFVRSFYKDHVQRYTKRPIYWLFSSPKGSFSALIYMHRYTPSTVSTVLNEYLREFTAKLTASLRQQQRLAADGGGTPRQQAAAHKEADRLRKVLLELEEYEHDVLYPLASRQLALDLDHGVKANYPKFGAALRKIPGLEASDE